MDATEGEAESMYILRELGRDRVPELRDAFICCARALGATQPQSLTADVLLVLETDRATTSGGSEGAVRQ